MPPDPIPGAHPPPAAPWHGRRGEWLVAIQFALFFAFILVPRWDPWLAPDLQSATAPLRLTALAVFGLVGLAFAALGLLQIRQYLTPLPYPVDHNVLVTDGVYAVVRHPMYSGLLFVALGWVCYTLSLSHLGLLILAFVFFDYKAAKEERWLTQRHPPYANYARSVRKFVPWLY